MRYHQIVKLIKGDFKRIRLTGLFLSKIKLKYDKKLQIRDIVFTKTQGMSS